MTPQEYMEKAYAQAKIAERKDEVPVGAVIVDRKSGKIISRAHNLTEHAQNCTCHAEISAIQKACKKLKTNRLRETDLYVTLEPCAMCAAAISFARIENLYFGAYDKKNGAVVNGVKFYENETCHHKPQVFGGVEEEKCGVILQRFFKNKRNKKIILTKSGVFDKL